MRLSEDPRAVETERLAPDKPSTDLIVEGLCINHLVPQLFEGCQQVLKRLVDSFQKQDLEVYPPWERKLIEKAQRVQNDPEAPPFSIKIIDSAIPNAQIHLPSRTIFINLGLLQKFDCWDQVAFVLSHEIAHLVYREIAPTLTGPHKLANRAQSHDSEYFCDEFALRLVDSAGYSVNFASHSAILPEEERDPLKNFNLGILSSHPSLEARNLRLREYRDENYWENYSETSAYPFSEEERQELKRQPEIARLAQRRNTPDPQNIREAIISCFDLVREYLAETGYSMSKLYPSYFAKFASLSNKDVDIPDRLKPYYESFRSRHSKPLEEMYASLQERLKEATPPFEEFCKIAFLDTVEGGWLRYSILETSDHVNTMLARLAEAEEATKVKEKILPEIKREIDQIKGVDEETKKTLISAFEDLILKFEPIWERSGDFFSWPTRSRDFIDLGTYEKRGIFRSNLGFQYGRVSSTTDIETLRQLRQVVHNLPSLAEVDISHANLFTSLRIETLLFQTIRNKVIMRAAEAVGWKDPESHKLFVEILELCVTKFGIEGSRDLELRQLNPEYLKNPIKTLLRERKYLTAYFLLKSIPTEARASLLNDEELLGLIDRTEDSRAILARLHYKRTNTSEILRILNEGTWEEVKRVMTSLDAIPEEDRHQIAQALEQNRDRLRQIARDKVDRRVFLGKGFEFLFNFYLDQGCSAKDSFLRAASFCCVPIWGMSIRAQVEGVLKSLTNDELLAVLKLALEEDKYLVSFDSLKREVCNRFNLPLDIPQTDHFFHSSLGVRSIEVRSREVRSLLVSEFERSVPTPLPDIPQLAQLDDSALLFALHAGKIRASFTVNERLSQLKETGQLTIDQVSRLASLIPSEYKLLRDVWDTGILEPEEYYVKFWLKDVPYFEYFKEHGFRDFEGRSVREQLKWFDQNWPEATQYRDIILLKLFKPCWKNLQLDEKLEVLRKLYDKNRAGELLYETLDKALESSRDFDSRLQLVLQFFPEAGAERDIFLRKVLGFGEVSKQQIFQVFELLSAYSREATLKESFFHGTVLAYVSNLSPEDKKELFLWLVGSQQKPDCVSKWEEKLRLKLDFLIGLFRLKNFRDDLIKSIFAQNNGLFESHNREHLEEVLTKCFSPFFRAEALKSLNADEQAKYSKVLEFTREALMGLFGISSEYKKLTVLTRLLDRVVESDGQLSGLDLVCEVLSSYGVVGVKIGQILAEQPGLQLNYPLLVEKLERLKDSNPMDLRDAIELLLRNPRVVGRDFKVLRMLGAASIKAALLVEIDGEERVVKVLRPEANKGLMEEQEILRELQEILTPVVHRHFSLDFKLPDYSGRVFRALGEELDFEREKEGAKKLTESLEELGLDDKVALKTPEVFEHLSTKWCIVEERAPGVSYSEFCKQCTEEERRRINAALQRWMIEALLEGRVVHNDLHGGNIFVDRREDGTLIVTLIDTGSMVQIEDSRDLGFLVKLLTISAVPKSIEGVVRKYVESQLLPVGYPSAQLKMWMDLLRKLEARKRFAALTALFSEAETYGYKFPWELSKILLGLSKADELLRFYPENRDFYSHAVSFLIKRRIKELL